MSPGFCWIMTRIQPCLPPASHRALFFADKMFPKLSIFFHLFSPSRNNHDLLWVQYCGWDWRHSAHNMCSLPLWTWVWPFHTRYPGQLGSPELCIWWGNLWVVSGKISRNRRILKGNYSPSLRWTICIYSGLWWRKDMATWQVRLHIQSWWIMLLHSDFTSKLIGAEQTLGGHETTTTL